MTTRPFPFRRFGVFPAMLFCVSGVANVAAPSASAAVSLAAPAATEIAPPAPVPTRYIAFSDKADGRRLLFAARDSYRTAPALRVSGQWTTISPGGKTASGTETIIAQFGQGRLSVTSEAEETPKTVRRAIANGESSGATLLVTQYQATTPNPTRQYSRFPLDQTTPLTRSLQMARFTPATKAGELLLTPDWGLQNAALVYVLRSDSSAANTAVIQTDILNGDRVRNKVTRRYLIDAKTNRLRRYEEWRTSQSDPKPATKRRPADDGVRTIYRREDYTEASAPVTVATFSQDLPTGYTEQSPSAAALPPVPKMPAGADPKALALMRKWQTAQERFFTLNAVADFRRDIIRRSEDSRPNRIGRGRDAMLCTIWHMRPGQARIVVNNIDPKTQQPITKPDSLVVADGRLVRLNDYANGRSDTNDQRDPAVVPLNRMRQVARQAWDSGISWVFDGPPTPDNFDQVSIDTTSAAPALVFNQTYDGAGGRGQKAKVRILWRVTLGPDNLPREILSRRDTNIVGGYERDQPPTFTTTVRLRRVSVDSEPLPETFVLPQEIVRR